MNFFLKDDKINQKWNLSDKNTNHRKLMLGNRNLGIIQLSKILQIINNRHGMPASSKGMKMTHLDLSNNDIGDQGIRLLALWLKQGSS